MNSFLEKLEWFYLSWITWMLAIVMILNPFFTPRTSKDYWRNCKLLQVKMVSQGQHPSDILFVIEWKDTGRKDVRSVSNETYARWNVGDEFAFKEEMELPYADSRERIWSIIVCAAGVILLISKFFAHGD